MLTFGRVLRIAGGGTALVLILVCLGLFPTTSIQAQTKPNILLFVVDDLDAASIERFVAVGYMPILSQFVITPGTTFRHAYLTDARGCPARQSFLTGQYFQTAMTQDLPSVLVACCCSMTIRPCQSG